MTVIVERTRNEPMQIDYAILGELCGIQCTQVECAKVLGITRMGLHKILERDGHVNFKTYFELHSPVGLVSLRRIQFKTAMAGNVTMMIWLGKQYLGQKDKHEVEHIDSERRKELDDAIEALDKMREGIPSEN